MTGRGSPFEARAEECRRLCEAGAVGDCLECVRALAWALKLVLPARLAAEALRALAGAARLHSTWAGARAVEVAEVAQLEYIDKEAGRPILRLATHSYEGLPAGGQQVAGVAVTGAHVRHLGVICDGEAIALARGRDLDLTIRFDSVYDSVVPEDFEPQTPLTVLVLRQPTWTDAGGRVSVMAGMFKLAGPEGFLAGLGVAIINYACGRVCVREVCVERPANKKVAAVIADTFRVVGEVTLIFGRPGPG